MIAPLSSSSLVQFGVLDALLAGVYESGMPVSELRELGDFGLGCGEGLGSEVVALDGRILELTVDGPPAPMRDDETLPFVQVCRFPRDLEPEPLHGESMAALRDRIEERLASRNLFHAVRFDGDVAAIRVRVPPRESTPHRPLAEVTHDQIESLVAGARGTLVGFWGPDIYQGVAVAGLHLHFLSADGRTGGHVLDLADATGELRMTALSGLDLRLPTDPAFLARELSHDDDRRIVAIESASQQD